MLNLNEMKEKITAIQNKETRVKERLALTQEQMEKQFGTTDIETLNSLVATKRTQAEELLTSINSDMEKLNNILSTCDV